MYKNETPQRIEVQTSSFRGVSFSVDRDRCILHRPIALEFGRGIADEKALCEDFVIPAEFCPRHGLLDLLDRHPMHKRGPRIVVLCPVCIDQGYSGLGPPRFLVPVLRGEFSVVRYLPR
jgi:hypothetical protein